MYKCINVSYIQVPIFIGNKKSVINPENTEEQCFKWAILTKHLTGKQKYRANKNYNYPQRKI